MQRSQAILILGMHRSGTSALTRVLNLLGAALANRLVRAASDNEPGFWESLDLNEIHEEALAALGSSWHDLRPLPHLGHTSSDARSFRERIVDVLRRDFRGAPLFVIKDPRLCLLLPLWRDVLVELDIDPLYVIPLRQPLEIAASLARRDGFATQRSLLLWLKYFLAAERESREGRRAFVHYDDLLKDWRLAVNEISRSLAIEWPKRVVDVEAQIDEFIDAKYRHHHSRADELWSRPDVDDWVKTAYRWALEIGRGHSLPYDDLDRIAAELRKAVLAFAPLLNEDPRPLETARLAREHRMMMLALTKRETEIREADRARIALQRRLAVAEESRSHLALAAEASRLIADKQATIDELTARLQTLQKGAGRWLLERLRKGRRDSRVSAYEESHAAFSRDDDGPGADSTLDVGSDRGEIERNAVPGSHLRDVYAEGSTLYQPAMKRPSGDSPIRLIAFYLPQFHPIPENDRWWGQGFTEWTNVTRAKPQFVGHYQPHLPADLGFYDLRIAGVQAQQQELARHYGVHGFCYHYYWFGGRTLLDRPLRQILDDPRLDQPFCICWANENWTRRWDGAKEDLLVEQPHSPDSDFAFIQAVEPIFHDPRYIRVEDRPLLLVYRADILAEPAATSERWRRYCRESGSGEPFLVAAQTFGLEDPTPLGFDAAVEFPPHPLPSPDVAERKCVLNPFFEGSVFSYETYVLNNIHPRKQSYTLFPTVMPGWDNSPRTGARGCIFADSSPRMYQELLQAVCDDVVDRQPPSKRLVFVNAWNEWAEGAHLEPDQRYGYAYLNATAAVLRKSGLGASPGRRRPIVSVVLPTRNDEAFISRALESVLQQTLPELEIIVVDRASTDRTLELVRGIAAGSPRLRLETIPVDEDVDCAAAINRGVELASGDFIATLDVRDLYHPQRIALLRKALDDDSVAQLAFSAVHPLDAHGHMVADADSGVRIREKYAEVTSYPRLEYALVDANLIASPGNLFFRRELVDMVGGLENFEGLTEWDFALRTLHFATPVFLPEPLYFISWVRASTAFDGASALGPVRDAILHRFFDSTQTGVLRRGVPSRRFDHEYFHEFVTARGYERFVSSSAEPISRHWYSDGWAPPKLRLPLTRGGKALRLCGRLPVYYPMLHGQNLRIFIDGRPAGSYSVEPGDFEVCFPANSAAAIVDIEIHASRWMVPKDDLEDSGDARRLAYLIDKVEWQTARPRDRPGVLEEDTRR
jgi:glycosyltransferase involved in cell wall biosynthesis